MNLHYTLWRGADIRIMTLHSWLHSFQVATDQWNWFVSGNLTIKAPGCSDLQMSDGHDQGHSVFVISSVVLKWPWYFS